MLAHYKFNLTALAWIALVAMVLFNSAQASVFFARVKDGELADIWNDGGLDAICQRSFPWFNHIGASRPYSSKIQAEITTAMFQINFTKEAFIAARLYPQFSHGWYWPGPAWSNDSAFQFFTDYSEDGKEVNYSHWAANGLPPSSEPYGTRQAVIYNHTTLGWQAVPLTSNVSYVLCEFGIVYPPVTTTQAPPSTTTTSTTSTSTPTTQTETPDDNGTSGDQNDSSSCSITNNTDGTTTICITTSDKTFSITTTTTLTTQTNITFDTVKFNEWIKNQCSSKDCNITSPVSIEQLSQPGIKSLLSTFAIDNK